MRLFHILAVCLVIGQAATAAQGSESNTAASGYSAAALFNRGNACARDGNTALAILNYERAQLLAPNDADIAANLHFVRAKAGLPDVSESWLSRSLNFTSPNTLAWLGSVGLVLAGASLLLVRLYSQRRLAFRALIFAGALLVVTAIGSAIAMWPKANEAVVIVRDASVLTSPAPAAEPLFKLRDGEIITVCAQQKDFVLVQTSTGRSGWVGRADLAPVVPQLMKQS